MRREFTAQQAKEEEGDEVVGNNSYEGTTGQACKAHLMDQLFDSDWMNYYIWCFVTISSILRDRLFY